MTRFCFLLFVMAVSTQSADRPLAAAEPDRTPAEWLSYFSAEWDETAWDQQIRGYPDGYMRASDDDGWKARMLVLQGFVRSGEAAVPALLDALDSDDVPVRILAAQALGHLAPYADVERLNDALADEPSPTVRLYLVDAIGMHGEAGRQFDWDSFLEGEMIRDVRKHVGYVLEREGRTVDPTVVEELASWDPSGVDTAVVGQPAPDFELTSAQGSCVKFSDFRGEKSVVLVFIYGDT